MKIIDKYLLRHFSVPLGYCLIAFSMIFVIADLFEHLSEFIQAKTPVLMILRYYAYVLPALLVFIAPVSLLLGVLYSLWQLTRNNELVAMRASGISFYRIIMPFLAVGLTVSIVVSVIQESVAPWSSYWAAQFISRQGREDDVSTRYAHDLSFRSARYNRTWAIRKFDLDSYAMIGVKVVKHNADGSTETIYAEEGKYYDGCWWFFNVTTRQRDAESNPLGPASSDLILEMPELSESPNDFVNVVKDPMFLSARELWEFLKTHAQLAGRPRARMMVDMHVRMAMPWTGLIVTLFAIPCGIYTGRKGPFMGVVVALSTFFGFYLLMTFCQWLGKNQVIEPFLSAWLPNVVFLSLGVLFMLKAK